MTDLTCREVSDFLLDYLEDELAPQERAAFERHLQHCDECVVYIRQYEAGVRLGRAAMATDDEDCVVPERLAAAILAARPRPR